MSVLCIPAECDNIKLPIDGEVASRWDAYLLCDICRHFASVMLHFASLISHNLRCIPAYAHQIHTGLFQSLLNYHRDNLYIISYFFYHLKSNSLELYSLWRNPVGFGYFTQHFTWHTCCNHALRYVGSDHASRAYHTSLAYRHTATNCGVCANPNTIFNSDWIRRFERT